jgi:hypothetical protein
MSPIPGEEAVVEVEAAAVEVEVVVVADAVF